MSACCGDVCDHSELDGVDNTFVGFVKSREARGYPRGSLVVLALTENSLTTDPCSSDKAASESERGTDKLRRSNRSGYANSNRGRHCECEVRV